MSVKVIFCGDRMWKGWGEIRVKLRQLQKKYGGELVIVTGGAKGADMLAYSSCIAMGIQTEQVLADWVGKGRAAGPARNREMLKLGPVAVYAFKRDDFFDESLRGGGTENMIRIAREAGIRVARYNGARWVNYTIPK